MPAANGEDTALRATVARKSDELGERRRAADGPGAALKPTPRGRRSAQPLLDVKDAEKKGAMPPRATTAGVPP